MRQLLNNLANSIGKFDLEKFLNLIFDHFLPITTAITLLLFMAFFIPWLREPRKLIHGVTFTIFFLTFLFWLAVLIFSTNNERFITIMGLIFIFLVFLLFVILAFSWLLFLWNALIVWRHESHTLANMLTLLLGSAMLLWFLIRISGVFNYLPKQFNVLLTLIPVLFFYVAISMYFFLTNLILYQLVPKGYKATYLIVLGAGLIDGERVTPLLARRIDRALAFRHKQIRKGRPAPVLIFSGGQGPDEKISEAQAMANYALTKGLTKQEFLLEDRSVNTYQNMLYSKRLIDAKISQQKSLDTSTTEQKAIGVSPKKTPLSTNQQEITPVVIKFFTNNYHTLRAGLLARAAGLNANGVGAKTRFYYLPNAVIREFAAVFLMNKKRHIFWMSIITLVVVGFSFIR